MTSLHGGSDGIAETTRSEPTTTQSTMATGFTFPPPSPLEIHDGNVAEKWKKVRLAWSNYALATELNKSLSTGGYTADSNRRGRERCLPVYLRLGRRSKQE